MTQSQLAAQLGITKSVISFYELRERAPSPEVLIKLAHLFHVSADYLLGIERQAAIDVSGLTASQVSAVQQIITEYRLANKNTGCVD